MLLFTQPSLLTTTYAAGDRYTCNWCGNQRLKVDLQKLTSSSEQHLRRAADLGSAGSILFDADVLAFLCVSLCV